MEKSDTTLNRQPMLECDQYCYLGDNIDGRNSPKANLERLRTKANLDFIEIKTIVTAIDLPNKEIQIALKLIETILIPRI